MGKVLFSFNPIQLLLFFLLWDLITRADRRAVDREVKFVVSALCRGRTAPASSSPPLRSSRRYLIAIHVIAIWGPGMAQASWCILGLILAARGMGSGVSPAAWGQDLDISPQAISPRRERGSQYVGRWRQPTPGSHPLRASGPRHHLSNHCHSNISISSRCRSIPHQSCLKRNIQVVAPALLMDPSRLHFQGSEGSKLYPQYLFLLVVHLGIYVIRSRAESSAVSAHQRRDAESTPPGPGSQQLPPSLVPASSSSSDKPTPGSLLIRHIRMGLCVCLYASSPTTWTKLN